MNRPGVRKKMPKMVSKRDRWAAVNQFMLKYYQDKAINKTKKKKTEEEKENLFVFFFFQMKIKQLIENAEAAKCADSIDSDHTSNCARLRMKLNVFN